MNESFDKLIHIILNSGRELRINKKSKDKSELLPRVYYIGVGKTGSSCIKNGFPKTNTAHWHSVEYFESIYKTNILSKKNYDLYDFIFYIGSKYNFLPIIIESIRNPLDLELSTFFQHLKDNLNFHNQSCEICKFNYATTLNQKLEICKNFIITKSKKYKLPYSQSMCKKHFSFDIVNNFDISKNYLLYNTSQCKILILKYDNIQNWSNIISECLNEKFILTQSNVTKISDYTTIRNKLKFATIDLPFLNDNNFAKLFSLEEINSLKKKYIAI